MGFNNLSQDWSLNCHRTKSGQNVSLCSVPAVLDYDTSSCVPKIHHKLEYPRDRFQLVTEIRRAPKIKPHQAIVLSFMFFVTILKAFASLGDSEYVYSRKINEIGIRLLLLCAFAITCSILREYRKFWTSTWLYYFLLLLEYTNWTIHILCQHILGPSWTHPLCQHNHNDEHQQKVTFLKPTHPLESFWADEIYGWSLTLARISSSAFPLPTIYVRDKAEIREVSEPLLSRAVGRSEYPEGRVVIQGLRKRKVVLLVLPKSGKIAPSSAPRFRRPCCWIE